MRCCRRIWSRSPGPFPASCRPHAPQMPDRTSAQFISSVTSAPLIPGNADM